MALLLIIRYHLSSENKRRDAEPLDTTYDDVYIERMDKNGDMEKVRVDKVGTPHPKYLSIVSLMEMYPGILGPD